MKYWRESTFVTLLLPSLVCVAVVLLLVLPGGASTRMPEFALPAAVDGKVVNSGEFKGKALLITFFATWCPPCRQEIPTLIKLHKEYGPRGFAVIGLSMDAGGSEIVAKLVRGENINYPVLMANMATANNFGGVTGVPTTFLVNKSGNVVKSYIGYVPHSTLAQDIELILR